MTIQAPPLLALDRVAKAYGPRTVLAPTSFTLEAGSVLAVLGPSGCGKTTLLSLVAGLIAPTSGRIVLAGADLHGVPAERRGLPMVFQEHLLFPHLNVHDNIAFGLRMRRRPAAAVAAAVDEALAAVQLSGYGASYPAQLSGGQRQRVALARAMVLRPRLILMDEPFSSLDTQLRAEMRALVLAARQALGFSVIVVTHDPEEAMAMADQVAVMRDGQIEQLAPPAAVYFAPRTRFVASFLGPVNLLAARVAGAGSWQLADGTLVAAESPGLEPSGLPAAYVSIRPEALRIAATPGQAGATLAATVTALQHSGAKILVQLASAAGAVQVQAPSLAADRAALTLAPGAAVHLRWDPRDVAVVAP